MVPNDDFTNGDGPPDNDISMMDQSDIDTKNDLIDLTLSTDDVKLRDDDESEGQPLSPKLSQIQDYPEHPKLFKRTDRLMNDLINDISMFEVGYESGILNLPTIVYANNLSTFLQNHGNDSAYRLGIINNKIDFAPSQETLENGVAIIRGFLYQRNALTNPFQTATLPLYNVKIMIKHPNTGRNGLPPVIDYTKHGFYNINDDELTPENREALVIDYAKIYDESKFKYNARELATIKKAIPNVIDSGTFISSSTKALIRIELHTGFFDAEALDNFKESEILLRHSAYTASASPSNATELPTPLQCFASITRILKGPLAHSAAADIRTIRSDHKIANVHAGVNFMLEYLSFSHSEEAGELFPPDLNLPLLRESFVTKYLEALFFSKSPSITLGDESIVSHVLCERVEFGAAPVDAEERRADALASYIALTSRHRYSDNEIRDAYHELLAIDPLNELKYFDHLCEVASQRKTINLKGYVSRLRSEGHMGFRDLCECYHILEIPPDKYEVVTEEQLLQQYKGLLVVNDSTAAKDRARQALLKIAKLNKSQYLLNNLNAEPLPDVEKAFEVLDVNATVDSDLIITALEVEKVDVPSEANLYDRALLTIAIHRKSFVLLEYIERKLSYLNRCLELDFSKAYEYLGADTLANDFQLITIFQERLSKDPSVDIRVLRAYLRHIGKQKKSKLINEFLKRGIIEPAFLPIENTPVGLNNIGNTCYLNSLLQYYFVIEPLRSAVLNFNEMIDEETFNNDETFAKRRIGSRTVGFKETERSYQFVYQLRDLFEELIKSNVRCISPKRELSYLSFSPSTDEVEFQIGEEEPDYSNMQLVPRRSSNSSNADSPIIVDSDDSSQDGSGRSVISLNSAEFDADFKDRISKFEPEDDIAEEVFQEGQENTPLGQSPQKRRLSTESYDGTSNNNKAANIGHSETVENADINVEVTEVESTKPKKNTSATCKISADQMENALEMGRQQDVTECIQNVLFQLESAFSPHHLEDDDEQYDLIKELFYGKTKQILQPFEAAVTSTSTVQTERTVRTKVERFLSLLVNIGDHPKDIYDALDTYFTEDVITMDDGDVKRSLTITEIPKVLQIQIQRVQFDRVRLMPVKSIEPIPFEEKLYMDRYMETDDPEIVKRRREVFEWKHRISILNSKKEEMNKPVGETSYNVKEGLTYFKNYVATDILDGFPDLNIKPETMECLDSVLKDIYTKEEEIASEMTILQDNIANQFANFTKVGYSLFAIFIHRGEASYGHYWIYIKDPKRNIYRKYNDEMVTEVPLEEVFNFEEGNTATPYFLVYVKEDFEDTFVEPLKREIESGIDNALTLD